MKRGDLKRFNLTEGELKKYLEEIDYQAMTDELNADPDFQAAGSREKDDRIEELAWGKLFLICEAKENERKGRIIRGRIEGDMRNRRTIHSSVGEISHDPTSELERITLRKIMRGKVEGRDVTYNEALIEAQKENPELAAAILGQMDEDRRRPASPWEKR